MTKAGGVVSSGSPSPRAREAESDSRGDQLQVKALVLLSVSEKHR